MKKTKIFLLLAMIVLLATSLVACDAVSLEDLEQFQGGSEGEVNKAAGENSNNDSMDDNSSDDLNDDSSGELKFKGVVEDVTLDTITFAGETFTVATTEDLTTLFTAGNMFQIEYMLNADGTITISQFGPEDSLDDDSSGELKFKGMVEDVTANTITIGGETFTVVTEDDLTTLFTAGDFYEIEYKLNDDGTITIYQAGLEDSFGDDSMDDSGDDSMDDSSDDSYDDSGDDNSYDDNSGNSSSNDDNSYDDNSGNSSSNDDDSYDDSSGSGSDDSNDSNDSDDGHSSNDDNDSVDND